MAAWVSCARRRPTSAGSSTVVLMFIGAAGSDGSFGGGLLCRDACSVLRRFQSSARAGQDGAPTPPCMEAGHDIHVQPARLTIRAGQEGADQLACLVRS